VVRNFFHREIGPLGTAARLLVGLLLVGLIVYGQLATSGHLALVTWVLGLLVFPTLVLTWHVWRIRRNPAPFSDASPLSFVLSLVLPLAFYLTGWYVPILWFTGGSLLLATFRGSSGCEFLALSNWLLRRLHTHRLPGTLNELPLSLKKSAMRQPITVPLRKARGARRWNIERAILRGCRRSPPRVLRRFTTG
jgi:hypothetical protein